MTFESSSILVNIKKESDVQIVKNLSTNYEDILTQSASVKKADMNLKLLEI